MIATNIDKCECSYFDSRQYFRPSLSSALCPPPLSKSVKCNQKYHTHRRVCVDKSDTMVAATVDIGILPHF